MVYEVIFLDNKYLYLFSYHQITTLISLTSNTLTSPWRNLALLNGKLLTERPVVTFLTGEMRKFLLQLFGTDNYSKMY